jgi:hypothetical protein
MTTEKGQTVAVGSDGLLGDSTPQFACCGVKHRWAYNWLKAHNWRPEAWALYALRGDYNGKHDGDNSIPVRVRALAEDVWSDLLAGRITSETVILDYEADLPPNKPSDDLPRSGQV